MTNLSYICPISLKIDMKNKSLLLLVVITLCFVTLSSAQRRKAKGTVNIVNGIAVGGGITQYDILTDDFNFVNTSGWIVGMSATVDIPHKIFNLSYGMQISQNELSLAAKPSALSTTKLNVDYKLLTAQLAFLWHFKLGTDHVTLDIGPMLQYNSELEIKDKELKPLLLEGFTNATAGDISNINNFNFNGAVGLTAGISHFKLRAQYMYGITNILGSLNKTDFAKAEAKQFKGNQSMLALTAMISF